MDDLLVKIIQVVAYIAPYFLIPATFKAGMGVFGNLAGMVNDRSRGLFDRQRKYRDNLRAQNNANAKNYGRFKGKNRVSRGLNTMYGAGSNPWRDLRRGRAGIAAGRRTGQMLQGAANLKNDDTFEANQNNDNFLIALANRGLAEKKLLGAQRSYAAAQNSFNNAATDKERDAASSAMVSARQEMVARQNGLDLAARVETNGSPATRRAALSALAKTGYQFSSGDQGYQELYSTAAEIAGNDQAALADIMDDAQYNLKNAGRLDLGGINHGAKNSIKSGIRKQGNYGRGQGKANTYHGGAEAWLGTSSVRADGSEKSQAEIMGGMQAALAGGKVSYDDIAEWHGMLTLDKQSANDGNKIEIQRQLDAIEALGRSTNNGPTPSTQQELDARTKFIADLQNNRRQSRTPIDPSELT